MSSSQQTHFIICKIGLMTQVVGRGSLRPFTVAALLLSPSGKEAALDVPRLTVCWSTKEDYYLLVIGDDDDVVLLWAKNMYYFIAI